jgi:uroporphyrinogen decarboxylase
VTDRLAQSRFMKACRRETVDATPVWLMRQAGRYMKEYRDARAKVGFKELCLRPELAAEAAVTAQRRLGVDAAILFSDILLILEPMGARLEYEEGAGPQVDAEVGNLRAAAPDALEPVMDAVRQTRAALPPDVPLIGFCGAPFTLASYLVEGRSAREAARTKAFMWTEPAAWRALMDKLVDGLISYLRRQVEAGVQAVQVFDSWAGALAPRDYREFVLEPTRRLLTSLPPSVPVIHFGAGNPSLLESLRDAGGSVIGVDWRIGIGEAWTRLGAVAVQGNLDPAALLADRGTAVRGARAVLEEAGGRPGHIFNLGHGVLQHTPVDNAIAVVDAVHEFSRR